jgi:hypothetical protein
MVEQDLLLLANYRPYYFRRNALNGIAAHTGSAVRAIGLRGQVREHRMDGDLWKEVTHRLMAQESCSIIELFTTAEPPRLCAMSTNVGRGPVRKAVRATAGQRRKESCQIGKRPRPFPFILPLRFLRSRDFPCFFFFLL